jgi:septal ring factor EnvC (AmiA/AmiB activator)
MIEQLISLGMGLASGSAIAFLFYKIFTKKYEKLLNFANEMIEELESSKEITKEKEEITEKEEGNIKEMDEIDEINQEIRELRKQLIHTKDPRMYQFLIQKIKYLEGRKKGLMRMMQYGLPSRTSQEQLQIDISQINWEELLKNVDKLPDNELMALVNQFKSYIPKQFRQYANNPLLVRMFLKHIAPLLIPKPQKEELKPQEPKKEDYTVV